jgi:hypothetical protein
MRWNFWKIPTVEELRYDVLMEAHRDIIAHQKLSEYHSAMAEMLEQRIKRLEPRCVESF